MIKNQRPYQLIYSKTNNGAISLFAAYIAKAAGICISAVSAAFGKEYVDFENISEVREALQTIYPKPKSDNTAAAMPAADEKVDVSIIVPAYNAEKYITKCIDSILNQNTNRSFEVIAVNDNSSDNTMLCLERYKNNSLVRIVDFKAGGSAAKARNEGLLHSVGRNIMFVDSDDVLAENAVETLLCNMEKSSADVVQGGWSYIDEADRQGLTQQYADAVYDGKTAADRFDLPGVPWGKIYKRELFENIRFPSEYTCFEDAVIHFLVFRKAKVIQSINDVVYYWRKNPAGITQNSQSKNKSLQSYWIVEELIEKSEKSELVKDEWFKMCVIGQLSNFCYVNVAGIEKDIQKKLFTQCCDLYEKNALDLNCAKLPYALRLGADALRKKRFDLWVKQGKLYSLIR